MIITMNKKMTLEFHKQKYGHNATDEIIDRYSVWGCAGLPSMNFKNTAKSTGVDVDLVVHLYRKDFDRNNWTHIIIDNTLFKITSTGTSVNELFIKLAVARGV